MEELEKRFIEYYQEIGRLLGFDSLLASIFGTLYLEPEPIAMDELAKKTGYSLASISNKVKFLESMAVIKRTRKPGSKKVFVYLEKDFAKLMKEGMKKQEYMINTAKARIPELIKEFKPKAKTEKQKKKLKLLENYHKQILKMDMFLVKMIKEFDKL